MSVTHAVVNLTHTWTGINWNVATKLHCPYRILVDKHSSSYAISLCLLAP